MWVGILPGGGLSLGPVVIVHAVMWDSAAGMVCPLVVPGQDTGVGVGAYLSGCPGPLEGGLVGI